MLFLQNYLTPCKIAFAFLSIGGDTLFGIFALETQLLQLALDCQRLRKCDLGTGLHRAFNSTDRLGSAVGRTEAACILNDLFPVVLRLINVVDEAQFLRLFKAHQLALGHKLDSLILGKRASQALRTTGTGKHTKCDLRQTESPRVRSGTTDISGTLDLTAPYARLSFA